MNFRHARPVSARLRLKPLALGLGLALTSHFALATDGYFQHGYGVQSQGLGGVGIALPLDGLAAATNPAGTALVGNRLDLGLTWFAPKRGAEIQGNGAFNGGLDGSGKKDFFLPEFGYTRQIDPQWGVGLAVYGNGGMNTQYDQGVPLFGRSKAGVNLEQLFISPSVAWKPVENHSLGLAINFAYQRFEAKGLENFDNGAFSTSAGSTKPNQARRMGLRPKWPMSAYSASVPVTASTTEPSATNATHGLTAKNFMA